MIVYAVIDALKHSGYGPTINYYEVYEDSFELEASDEKSAIATVESIQENHDQKYELLGATELDLEWSPCYVNNLWRKYKGEEAEELEKQGLDVRVWGQDCYVKVEL